MNTLKSKLALVGVLLSGSWQVSAHTGNHGISSWHHYLASADHLVVLLLLVLSGLGMLAYFARKPPGIRTPAVRRFSRSSGETFRIAATRMPQSMIPRSQGQNSSSP